MNPAIVAEDEYFLLKQRALGYTQHAVNKGLLPKLDGTILCVDCSAPATRYDHRDYRKPKDVEPVCRACNSRRGPAAPGHENWRVYNNWNSLGGGDGEEIELNGRLAIDIDLNAIEMERYVW